MICSTVRRRPGQPTHDSNVRASLNHQRPNSVGDVRSSPGLCRRRQVALAKIRTVERSNSRVARCCMDDSDAPSIHLDLDTIAKSHTQASHP